MERVAWVPGWYELDPPLEVGRDDKFIFWRHIPDHLRGPELLGFYNTLWHPGDGVFATGRIIAIRHPELGADYIEKLNGEIPTFACTPQEMLNV